MMMGRVPVLHSRKSLVVEKNLLSLNHPILDPKAVMTRENQTYIHVEVLLLLPDLLLLDLHPNRIALHLQEDVVLHLDLLKDVRRNLN